MQQNGQRNDTGNSKKTNDFVSKVSNNVWSMFTFVVLDSSTSKN